MLEEPDRLLQLLGPCLVVAKCYEVSGSSSEAGAVARQVWQGELERLQIGDSRGLGLSIFASQSIRAIYALSLSGNVASAKALLSELSGRVLRAEGHVTTDVRYLQAVGALLLDQMADLPEIEGIPELLRPVVSAWFGDDVVELREAVEYAEDEATLAMGASQGSSCSDGWFQLILYRARQRVAGRSEAA